MAYNNQIILRGNLGKDPEVIQNPDGSTRVEISICTQDAYKVNQEWKQLPEVWHKVTFFGPQAQQHAEYFRTGQRVKIEGSLSYYKVEGKDETFILGGEQIYELAMPYTQRIYLTEIEGEIDGDVFFPEFDKEVWREVARSHHPTDDRHKFAFDFVTYEKI